MRVYRIAGISKVGTAACMSEERCQQKDSCFVKADSHVLCTYLVLAFVLFSRLTFNPCHTEDSMKSLHSNSKLKAWKNKYILLCSPNPKPKDQQRSKGSIPSSSGMSHNTELWPSAPASSSGFERALPGLATGRTNKKKAPLQRAAPQFLWWHVKATGKMGAYRTVNRVENESVVCMLIKHTCNTAPLREHTNGLGSLKHNMWTQLSMSSPTLSLEVFCCFMRSSSKHKHTYFHRKKV